MDQAHANQYNGGAGQNNGPQNIQYNQAQNDPFQSFINTDDDNAFDNTWQSPDFSHQPTSTNNEYDHNVQQWPQHTSYQPADTNFLPMSQYGVDPRYAGSGSNFQYPTFDSHHTQGFPGRQSLQPSSYAAPSDFSSNSLSNGPPYQYSRSPDTEHASQTISPSAITSYPDLSEAPFNNADVRTTEHFTVVVFSIMND